MWRPHPAQWLKQHPVAADSLLALLLLIAALASHLTGPHLEAGSDAARGPTWWSVSLVAGAIVPLAWRRRAPIAAAAVVVAFQITCELVEVHGAGWLGVLVALYSVGAHASGRRRVAGTATLLAAVLLLFVAGIAVDELDIGELLATMGLFVAALVLGDNMQTRRRRVDELAERAERAERERELLARERVAEERTRIARELHDVVAHSVSVMVIQAAAARRNLATRPDESVELLSLVEETGRATMDELRRVLGVLRSDGTGATDGGLAPQPTLQALPALVAADPDLPVELVIEGSVDTLPPGIALSAYRIVQEALTNVRRHAGPVRRVRVHVAADPGALDVRVDDDGRGAATPSGPAGFGLLGMRERIVALGGTLTAGPKAGGGWRVHARVPVAAVVPAAVAAATRPRASTA